MKNITNKVLTFFVLLLCVFAFVSCDSAVSESGEALVRFGEADGTSRGISADDLEGYTVDSLYWAYVAVKKDGLHTVGESEVTTTAASTDYYSKIVTVDGKDYILRPVRPDYEPGLNADVGPFSYGDWLFKLYGFKSCNGTEFTDLVYTGDTVGYTAITKSSTAVSVGFNLSPATAFPTTGTLVFGSLYYTVPANMKFYAGTTFTVTFKDATNGDKVVATATGTITTDCETGTEIPLSITYGAAASFDSGVQGQFNTPSPSYQAEHKFKVEIVYQSGVTSGTGHLQEPVTLPSSTRTFPVLFTAGNLTVLYGDVDDVVVDNGKSEVDNFGPVCKIGNIYYTSLTDAVASYTDSTTPPVIQVLRNVDYGGVFSKNLKICPVNAVEAGGVTGNERSYVKNITMASGKKVEFVSSPTSTTTAEIIYTGVGTAGSTLNYLSWCNYVCFIDSSGGDVTVNGTQIIVYHTGESRDVTVTNAAKVKSDGKGYHCWGKVTGTLSAANGYVELGASADVATLKTTSNNVVLTGHPTTKVGNMSAIYEGTSLTYKDPYKAVKFNGNGGKSGTATSLTKYGIEGMYLYKVLGGDVFINSDYCVNPVKNMCWGSSDKGMDPVYWSDTIVTPHANTKYLVGSAATQNLYAVWDAVLCPLGGYVFAFASGGVPCTDKITGGDNGMVEVNGVIYQFFNSNGVAVDVKGKTYQVVEETFGRNEFGSATIPLYNATATGGSYTLLTALKNGGAMYYKIVGKPASGYKDGVYVCPKDGYANGSSFNSGVYWGASSTSTRHNVITAEPAFGQGKVMSKTIVSTYTDIYKYDTSNSTIWSYLDWLNDGGKSSTSGTPWGAYTDTTIPSAKKEAKTCNDWFIPVAVEIGAMHKSGVLPSDWFVELYAVDSHGTRIDRRHIMTCCEVYQDGACSLKCYVWEKMPNNYIRNGTVARTSCGNTSATSGSVANTIYCRSF